jgi:hypothetical protein
MLAVGICKSLSVSRGIFECLLGCTVRVPKIGWNFEAIGSDLRRGTELSGRSVLTSDCKWNKEFGDSSISCRFDLEATENSREPPSRTTLHDMSPSRSYNHNRWMKPLLELEILPDRLYSEVSGPHYDVFGRQV